MNEDKLYKKNQRRRFLTLPLLVLGAHVLLLQETGDESWKKKQNNIMK